MGRVKLVGVLLVIVFSPAWGARSRPAQSPLGAAGDAAESAEHRYRPCVDPPRGMVCIPGGPAQIGADNQTSAESPAHVVHLSTFMIDRYEVTNRDYARCERARACPRRTRLPRSYKPFLQPDRPAVPIQWHMAHAYCLWAGKRLPTEAEWEKVARGGEEARLYPWGSESPDCSKAAYKGCKPPITQAVGSFPPGPYGVYDMAGNGYEWVHDWASGCYEGCDDPCGDQCRGRDPRGPCDGAPRCDGHKERVLKGGSWYWPSDQLRGSWRRSQRPRSGLHRLSFRCASSDAQLATWPPRALTDPPAGLPDPKPPSDKELAVFAGVPDDPQVMTIKPCRRKGLASLDCRDPMTYIKSNEAFQHIWTPYVKNLGGAYVGLGADQSYSFISLARSRWAWIFDYDPTVARIHHLIRAIVLRAETPVEFVDAFKKRNIKTTRAWIRESLAGDSEELAAVDETYRALRRRLYSHYYADMQMKSYAKGFGWLRYPKNYRYIRLMFQQGRLHAIMGNMLTAETLPRIAAAARALGVPIRIYYPSNAEEQWRLTPQYRQNVIGLPFDKRSIVLRTLISEDFRRDDQSASYWHYIVHWGIDAQRKMRLKGYTNVNQFTADKIDTPLELLSLIRMPAYTETEELTASAGPAP